ncbi:uncharacterized protein LOC100824369 [Brachypodium distachyon]|uniref:Uncharacterized protein n=1 Tax=Brachypodium distachyon TaxID=15368 RepID=I1HUC6_BRADI|nr:uncharacterized protein LOC100824369 [Brachypodium distachyon]KQK11085.1 hypothetical protein BRADI_2g58007v3 [Brachypodium distachyon]|eukprot:XP_010232706.1 uncharacterized protein LOC100824369 [Brachypodium distachyon]
MEASISSLCGALSDVLAHADSSSRALSDALSRRPIPLESATSAFLQGLDRRVEAAGADLARLESMAFDTVSVEELLGHFREALGIVSRHADAVESRLTSFGYVAPEVEDEAEDGNEGELEVPENGCFGGSSSVLRSGRERFDDDDALFDDSMSLKNLGFSDACLATLSSQDNDFSASPKISDRKPESVDDAQEITEAEEFIPPEKETDGQDGDSSQGMIRASKEQYEQLPPYMKTLASWEELHDAVSKLNSFFGGAKSEESVALNQDDVGSIGLGRKGRSYLLILLRLNQLTMQTIEGSIFYTLRKSDS